MGKKNIQAAAFNGTLKVFKFLKLNMVYSTGLILLYNLLCILSKAAILFLRAEVSHKLVARLSRCIIFEGVNFIKVYYIFPKLFNHCKTFSGIAVQVDKSNI